MQSRGSHVGINISFKVYHTIMTTDSLSCMMQHKLCLKDKTNQTMDALTISFSPDTDSDTNAQAFSSAEQLLLIGLEVTAC